LIAELDATDDDVMLRNLGFVLRAIGDKRAVPALIRALPRTCHRPTSDYGAKADDKDLNAFMQKHDIDEKDARGGYSFGRPVREIGGALQKLTGVKQGEEELYLVFLGGSEMQQYAQRSLYQRCASRWAEWWEAKWKSLVQDPQYAKVNLKVGADEPPVNFPHGPGFRLGEPMNGHIAESEADPKAKFVFLDIDTGRMAPLPEDLRAIADVSHRMDEIQAWAANEGFDLMGTEYVHEGEQKSNYFIRALGLTAWEIDTGRWKTLEQEITLPSAPKMGRPAGGLLVHFDVDRKQFDEKAPATFLFQTREGAHGVMFVGVEVHDTNVKLGERMPANVDMHPVGFKKGRRFAWRLVEPVAPEK
jgi:hypothetical protein